MGWRRHPAFWQWAAPSLLLTVAGVVGGVACGSFGAEELPVQQPVVDLRAPSSGGSEGSSADPDASGPCTSFPLLCDSFERETPAAPPWVVESVGGLLGIAASPDPGAGRALAADIVSGALVSRVLLATNLEHGFGELRVRLRLGTGDPSIKAATLLLLTWDNDREVRLLLGPAALTFMSKMGANVEQKLVGERRNFVDAGRELAFRFAGPDLTFFVDDVAKASAKGAASTDPVGVELGVSTPDAYPALRVLYDDVRAR